MTLFYLIGQFVRRHWRPYLFSAVLLAAITGIRAWIPHEIGVIVDGLSAHRISHSQLLQGLAGIGCAGLAVYAFRVGWRIQLFSAAYLLGVELRTRFYARMCAQGPSFFQRQRTGDLMALATNDVDAVEMAAGEAMLAGFDGSVTLVVVVGVMTASIDWRLALAALTPFPFLAMAFWYVSNQIHRASKASLESFGKLNDHIQETLSGVRTVRTLGLEGRSSAHFSELAGVASSTSLSAQRWEAAFEPTVGLSLVAATVITLSYGGYLVWHQQLTIGSLTAFTIYLGDLIWPMFAAGWVLSLMERGRAAWERLQPVLDTPLSIVDHGRVAEVEHGALQFEQVVLTYPEQSVAALQQLSFTLPAGQTLGLVGPTGAGKSSIVRLLLRQYSAQSGIMRWGSHALADYQLEALHAAIAWVPQEPFLFSASIHDNIALAKPGATRAEIEEVARLAAVHDDILRFAQGYDTPVGERGVTLSGGQRQRVAIARALLADAPLLLLDDALSAVDTQTETAILSHLREQRSRRTTVIVSHRLSAVMDADQILVLDHGRIIERGNHDALVARDGWYASQWRYQQLEASLDAL